MFDENLFINYFKVRQLRNLFQGQTAKKLTTLTFYATMTRRQSCDIRLHSVDKLGLIFPVNCASTQFTKNIKPHLTLKAPRKK